MTKITIPIFCKSLISIAELLFKEDDGEAKVRRQNQKLWTVSMTQLRKAGIES